MNVFGMFYKPDYSYIPPITWSVLTPLYDFFCFLGGLGPGFKARVLNAVEIQDGMKVADIGCGTGVFLKVAKQKFPNVRFVGVDPDKQALGIAERRLAKAGVSVELKNALAESLPLPPESADVCFSTLAFHHMPNEVKRKAIQEIYRVLKQGGKAVIADFGETRSVFFRKLLFFEKIEYLEGNFRGLIPQYLKEAGFKNVRVASRHFPGIEVVVVEK